MKTIGLWRKNQIMGRTNAGPSAALELFFLFYAAFCWKKVMRAGDKKVFINLLPYLANTVLID